MSLALLLLPVGWMNGQQADTFSKSAGELFLEDLINIKVTTVSKKETTLEDSPIRRLGIKSTTKR